MRTVFSGTHSDSTVPLRERDMCMWAASMCFVDETGTTGKIWKGCLIFVEVYKVLQAIHHRLGTVRRKDISGASLGRHETLYTMPRMKEEVKLKWARVYWICGFFFLPWVWLVNVYWFYREAFFKPSPNQAKFKFYVTFSLAGALVYLAGFITWIVIYQKNWASWGVTGEDISMNIPQGNIN
eukprot:Clim_evm66s172 gene=Clim_evmTU66s172